MAVNLAIISEIDITFDVVTFYTDSKIVFGYIFNEKKILRIREQSGANN